MRVVIAGGSGFVGRTVVRRLVERGHEVAVLSRDPAAVRAGRGVLWDGRSSGPWASEIGAADAVINLAGQNIGEGRWTESRKQELRDSRVQPTEALVAALRAAPPRPRTLINASATGFYGFEANEPADESSPRGRGYLAGLVEEWEGAARPAESFCRLVILRFGVVLAADGGALQKMMLPFRFGAGGPVGDGRQWMSWVDQEDLVRMVEWVLDSATVRGVYNVTAPEPVPNRQFADALGKAMHRPALLPAPGFILRLMFGQMAEEVLLGGQRAVPRRALAEGFTFAYPSIDSALRHALRR